MEEKKISTPEDVKKAASNYASSAKAAVKSTAAKATAKAAAAKKTVAKKAATVEEAAKAEVKEVKATATKKATAAKKTAKTAAKKAAKVTTAVIQYQGKEFTLDECVKNCEAAFKAENKRKTISEINVYVKPEEGKAYYVVNGGEAVGSINL